MSNPRTEQFPSDGLAPLAAMEQFGGLQANALQRASRTVEVVKSQLEEGQTLTDLAERVYLGDFMADTEAAAQAALDLSIGRGKLDVDSFGTNASEQQVRDYLAPFGVQDPSATYPFPRLWLPATAVIPFRGSEYAFDPNGYFRPLTRYYPGPAFKPDIQLPQLVDPQPRTFAEFNKLSQLDPGHAEQVMEAYRMAAREQASEHPGLHYKDPVIIRAVATLPVGDKYMTDFLPRVELGDANTVWDPRLLVGGSLNQSGNYLYTDASFPHDRVVYSADGQEAALRVTRPKPGERDTERDISLVGRADHEYNSMAVILFPYRVEKAPRRPIAELGSLSFGDVEPMRSFGGGGATRSAAIGDANIGTGSAGYFTATKRDTDTFGNRKVPLAGGQPLVYSIRLLTVSA